MEGNKVEFNKRYDDRKGKDRAEDVTGGSPEDPGFGRGGGGGDRYGGGGGDRYGGDRYGDRDRGYGDRDGGRDRDRGYGDRDRGGYGGDRDRGYGGDRDRGYGGDRDRGYGGDRGGYGGGGGGNGARPGDWECPKCQINCFASKSECFKCGEPKPGGGGDRGGDDRYR